MSVRQKAKDAVRLAVDKRTPDNERFAAALAACEIIERYSLLDSAVESLLDGVDNEAVRAAGDIFQRLSDPAFVRSVKQVGRAFTRERGEGRFGRRRRDDR
jgi:hypothetical protein